MTVQHLLKFPGMFSPRVWKIFQVFFLLQVLDILTTLVGLQFGAKESSIFVARLLQFGPVVGLLISKGLGLSLAVIAVLFDRERVVRFANFWFTAVVGWNLMIILTASSRLS